MMNSQLEFPQSSAGLDLSYMVAFGIMLLLLAIVFNDHHSESHAETPAQQDRGQAYKLDQESEGPTQDPESNPATVLICVIAVGLIVNVGLLTAAVI